MAALIVAGCGASADVPQVAQAESTAEPDAVTSVVAEEPAVDPEPTASAAISEPTAVPPTPEPTAEPVIGYADHLLVGDCFDLNAEELPGPALSCDETHHFEVFAIDDDILADVDPALTDDEQFDIAWAQLCQEASLTFAGPDYEMGPVVANSWAPGTELLAGDTRVMCTVEGLADDQTKIGTAASGDMRSDEYVVSTITWDGNTSLALQQQFTADADQRMLTWTEYVLPKAPADVGQQGIVFAAADSDSPDTGTGLHLFFYETATIESFIDFQPGWEKAGLRVNEDAETFVYAARENEADDWDLYALIDDAAVAITDNEVDDRWPTLTPDGSRVIWHSDGDLWTMNVDGSEAQQLTAAPGNDWESSVSPDGSMVAFTSDRDGNDDIWLMNIDGSGAVNLTNHPANDTWPFWSADNSVLYFQSDRLGLNSHLMLMELDGSNQSYYSATPQQHAALVPTEIAEALVASLPTAEERLNTYDTVVGDPENFGGRLGTFVTSDELLEMDLPAGWEVYENDVSVYEQAITGIAAAPSISDYNDYWQADGLTVTMYDAADFDELQAIADRDSNAQFCSEVALIEELDVGTYVGNGREYSCGDEAEGSMRLYVILRTDTQVGAVLEFQSDRVDEGDITDVQLVGLMIASLEL